MHDLPGVHEACSRKRRGVVTGAESRVSWLRSVETRLRLGEFNKTHEIDVNRHRAHLFTKGWQDTERGEPELLCGRPFQYGRGGWRVERMEPRRGWLFPIYIWTNVCPQCAQRVTGTLA